MKTILIVLCTMCCIGAQSQTEFSVVFYNLLNYPTAPPANREVILANILEELQPDIFLVCELESNAGSVEILNSSLNTGATVYASAPYQNNMSSGSDLQQLVYYNTDMFTLTATDVVINDLRDINRYTLERITDDDTDPQSLEIFVTHLKAGSSDSDQQIRFDMIQDFAQYLNTIDFDPDSNVIFAGDLNLSSSDESSYQLLLNNGTIPIVDPIDAPGDWNNNDAFTAIHTQSTRISSNDFDGFGAGGGLDSRFDFILFSENMLNPDNNISYVPNSYEAIGNNGNCFNNRIDSSNCDGSFSAALRDQLYLMSDHLPVVARLQVNDDVLSTNNPGNVQPLARFVRSNIITNERMVEIAFAKAETLPPSVTVYDQIGRRLQTITVEDFKLSIPVTTLSSGVYYIVLDGQSSEPLKFVKTP